MSPVSSCTLFPLRASVSILPWSAIPVRVRLFAQLSSAGSVSVVCDSPDGGGVKVPAGMRYRNRDEPGEKNLAGSAVFEAFYDLDEYTPISGDVFSREWIFYLTRSEKVLYD